MNWPLVSVTVVVDRTVTFETLNLLAPTICGRIKSSDSKYLAIFSPELIVEEL